MLSILNICDIIQYMYIERKIKPFIEEKLFRHNIAVIYGPRQSGKTTLVKKILEPYGSDGVYWNCENPEFFALLKSFDGEKIYSVLKGKKLFVLDEAQIIPNIGSLLKLLFDSYPDIQYIATGSSSFELSQQVGEPLVGRSWEFSVYPFGLTEVTTNWIEAKQKLSQVLVHGLYPEIWFLSEEEKELKLKTIASQYLAKDLLVFEGIRNSTVLQDLLRLLASRLGNEVSYNNLADTLQTSRQTIIRYIDILEKSFIIFRLHSYKENVGKQVSGKFKVYFYDIGIRNALINQFGIIDPLSRTDLGALWENFCILERMKSQSYTNWSGKRYFWRNRNSEIDYIEEEKGKLTLVEFKWNLKKNVSIPTAFKTTKPTTFTVVNNENFYDFINGVQCG